jgi:hypothetical protein
MAIDTDEAFEAASAAVLAALLKVYDNAAAEDVRPFAEAVAEAARVAVAHLRDNARTDVSGEGLT